MVSQNGGAPVPLVDPPGTWNCTIRTVFASDATNVSVSCLGNEKVISAGCAFPNANYTSIIPLASVPTGQGWSCSQSGLGQIQVYANCCL